MSVNFPALPDPGNQVWPSYIQEAHKILSSTHAHAVKLLQLDDGEPLRLRLHSEILQNRLIPLVEALEGQLPHHTDWIQRCTEAIVSTMVDLEKMAIALENIAHETVTLTSPVKTVPDAGPGRPRKVIDHVWLRNALSPHRNISRSELARALGVSRTTINRYSKLYKISGEFSAITDSEIDTLIRGIKATKPSAGLRYITGYFRKNGIRIQGPRIRASLKRTDCIRHELRRQKAIVRRQYKGKRPNFLWHMDGHHKLIRWGFVIHGMIDGFDRTVVGIRAHTNNRASTVLKLFLKAILIFGIPSRVRGDRGGENIEVSVWMIMHRGPKRGSFIWGNSTGNSRIERLWREVGSQVARYWRAFFIRLENLHFLDVQKPWHLWLLHVLFLNEINADLENFQHDWNHHPIARIGHDKSPADMRFLGELKFGKYDNELANAIHPDILQQYYGTEVENVDPSFVARQVTTEQEPQVRHDPIEVPSQETAFRSKDIENIFLGALHVADRSGIIPQGFGVAENEWEGGQYPDTETINIARKEVEVDLPFETWWPRAVRWARSLELVIQFQVVVT